MHPVWRMTRTSTGRIVASDPPVQSINKKKYRPLLIAPPGRRLMKADWKTCQARILAHLSDDPELIHLFAEGQDFHARTAQMLGLGSRDEAKPINFGIIFGQGPRALAREINASWKDQGQAARVDEDHAQEYIDTFFGTYKEIQPYFQAEYDKLTDLKVSERVLKNPVTGRIRRFTKSKSDKLMREMKATLLQQVGSHLLKLSLIRLSDEIRRRGLDAKIVACIHDSIWVEGSVDKEMGGAENYRRYHDNSRNLERSAGNRLWKICHTDRISGSEMIFSSATPIERIGPLLYIVAGESDLCGSKRGFNPFRSPFSRLDPTMP